mgnify:CR=1 FL=1
MIKNVIILSFRKENFETIEKLLLKALADPTKLEKKLHSQILLRLGTAYLLKDPSNKSNIQKARDYYLQAWNLDSNESKCFKAQALIYTYQDENYVNALKSLTRSFDLQRIDEDYFKLQFYLLVKCKAWILMI